MNFITRIGLFLLMFAFSFNQGVFNQYDIPEFEYKSFQISGDDLFSLSSVGDANTTRINLYPL